MRKWQIFVYICTAFNVLYLIFLIRHYYINGI